MPVFITSDAPFFVSLLQKPQDDYPYDAELSFGSICQPGNHTFRTHHIYMPTAHLAKDNETFQYQLHEGMEIIYITKGCGTLYLAEQELILHTGDIAFINPYELHNFQFDMGICERLCVGFFPNMLLSNIQALPEAARTLAEGKCQVRKLIPCEDPLQPVFSAYLCEILENCRGNSIFLPLELQGILLQLLASLLKYDCIVHDCSAEAIPQIILDTINYIGSHAYPELTTAMVSEHLGYTPAYFCREFRKYFGTTFTEYIQIVKTEAAKVLLLKEPDISLKQLAADMGYASPTYFMTVFQKHTGLSPAKFIKTFQKNRG